MIRKSGRLFRTFIKSEGARRSEGSQSDRTHRKSGSRAQRHANEGTGRAGVAGQERVHLAEDFRWTKIVSTAKQMNEDRIYGKAKNLGGKAEEGFGRVTGDVKSEVQGAAKQAEGAMQDVYGQAKDAATSAAEAIRETASEAGDFIRDTIERRPYTAAAVALAVGFLVGRFGRTNWTKGLALRHRYLCRSASWSGAAEDSPLWPVGVDAFGLISHVGNVITTATSDPSEARLANTFRSCHLPSAPHQLSNEGRIVRVRHVVIYLEALDQPIVRAPSHPFRLGRQLPSLRI
jgi:uncharacterized protein YjbJ (UPF0337 family)